LEPGSSSLPHFNIVHDLAQKQKLAVVVILTSLAWKGSNLQKMQHYALGHPWFDTQMLCAFSMVSSIKKVPIWSLKPWPMRSYRYIAPPWLLIPIATFIAVI